MVRPAAPGELGGQVVDGGAGGEQFVVQAGQFGVGDRAGVGLLVGGVAAGGGDGHLGRVAGRGQREPAGGGHQVGVLVVGEAKADSGVPPGRCAGAVPTYQRVVGRNVGIEGGGHRCSMLGFP